MSVKACIAILMVFFFVSCGENLKKNDSFVKAPQSIGDSFVVRNGPAGFSDRSSMRLYEHSNQIGIKISSLDKEFLLQGSLIFKPMVRRFENLKSRVVAFKLINNTLFMLEATQGHDINAKVTKDIILAEFPVTEVTGEFLYFDFAVGMSKIFLAQDWAASDFTGGAYPLDQWDSMRVESSYVKTARFDEKNNLILHQIAQVHTSGSNENTKLPVEVKYYLTPYRENPNFKPTVSELSIFEKMGFFEVTPQLTDSGKAVVYASKFDHSKPIVYAISANTPEEYREAIRSGVLYWNKAFGKEVLKVVEAPEGVEAPDFDYNVIQWVDWDEAGFAYADAQMDPRTGEILHAQIFMTSVFAVSSKSKAKKLLRRILNAQETNHHEGHSHHHHDHIANVSLEDHRDSYEKSSETKQRRIALGGFQKSEEMCRFAATEAMAVGLRRLIESETVYDESVYLKVSQDYVRETVAHEVGHTLGLRHNFAGSLYSNIDVMETDLHFKKYVDDGVAPEGIRTTSSVMEYQNFEDSVITGDQLVSKTTPLDYDLAVIRALYFGDTFKKKDLPPFCTDTHRGRYLDCQVFDSGNSIFKDSLRTETYYKSILPDLLLENYIETKNRIAEGKAESLKEGSFDPSNLIFYALSGRGNILAALSSGSKFLQVHRNLEVIGPFDDPILNAMKVDFVSSQLADAGGVEKLFQSMELSDIIELKTKFIKKLQDFEMASVVHSETPFFSREDLELIMRESDQFFQGLYFSHLIVDLVSLSYARNLSSESYAQELTQVIYEKAHHIIFAKEGVKEIPVGEQIVRVPNFVYPYQLRKSVPMLLKGASSDYFWGKRELRSLRKELDGIMDKSLGDDLRKADTLDLPEELGRWLHENKKVLSSLGSLPSFMARASE